MRFASCLNRPEPATRTHQTSSGRFSPRHPACCLPRTAVVATAVAYLCRRSIGEHDAALLGAAKALTSSATIRTNFPTFGIVKQGKVAALNAQAR
jgi:hypothetical protein